MINYLNVLQKNDLVHKDIIRFFENELRSHTNMLMISEAHLTEIFKDPYKYLLHFSRVLHPDDQKDIKNLEKKYNPVYEKKRELLKKIEKKKLEKKKEPDSKIKSLKFDSVQEAYYTEPKKKTTTSKKRTQSKVTNSYKKTKR